MSTSEKLPALPIKVDSEIIFTPNQLKKYPLSNIEPDSRHTYTVYSIYKAYIREGQPGSLMDYAEHWCNSHSCSLDVAIEPYNTKSRSWTELVKELLSENTASDIINNVISCALSDSKYSLEAAKTLAQWAGVTNKVELQADVKADVDAKVSLKPDLFQLPESNG